jgi:hydrogenase maturation protease
MRAEAGNRKAKDAPPPPFCAPRPCCLVLGIGNILRGDDGFGVLVARRLRKRRLPHGVKVVAGELRSLAYSEEIARAEHVILVDALDAGEPPGSLMTFTPDQVRSRDESASPHGLRALGILELLQALGRCPPVTLIACQRGSATEGERLSPQVEAALPKALAAVEAAIRAAAGSREKRRAGLR